MGLMAGEMEAGRGWRPTVTMMCPPWLPPHKLCKYSIPRQHPDLHSPSSHRLFLLPLPTPHSHLLLVSSSDTLLPWWTPGVLLSSSPEAMTQALCSHARSPELTKDHKPEKQVLGHGPFESAGGTAMGEDPLPATQLRLCLGTP